MAVAARGYEAPVGEVEETIARIWEELLGLERVGRHDHFFELGGDSLLAIKLFYLIETQLTVTIPIVSIFNAPTVATLGALIGTTKILSSGALPPHTPALSV
jgi:acyl carrier protein